MIIYLAPWLVNVVVKALGWIILLSDFGYLNKLLLALGLIHQPLHLLYNDLGIIIGLTDGEMVFAVLPIFASLASIDPNLSLAAANLGAKAWQSFFRIIFPLTLPGVVAGSIIVFTMSMAAYTTPALLGGAQSRVLSYMVYQQNTAVLNWPFGNAMGAIMVAATVAIAPGVHVGHVIRQIEGDNEMSGKKRGVSVLSLYNLIITIIMLAPLVVVILTSFTRPCSIKFPHLTLVVALVQGHFCLVGIRQGFLSSCELAVLGALISLAIGFFTAFVIVRYDFRSEACSTAWLWRPSPCHRVVLGLALLQF